MRMEKVFFQFKLTARVPTLPTNHWNKVYKHLLFSIAPISGFCLFGWQKPCVLQFGHSTTKTMVLDVSYVFYTFYPLHRWYRTDSSMWTITPTFFGVSKSNFHFEIYISPFGISFSDFLCLPRISIYFTIKAITQC